MIFINILKEKVVPKIMIIGVSVVMATASCGGDDNGDCTCDPIAHLGIDENCDCGKNNCTCELQVYGNIAGIPVYREGITDDQARPAFGNVKAGYDSMKGGQQNITTAKVSKIIIIAALLAAYMEDPDDPGKFIITLSHALDSDLMRSVLESFAGVELVQVKHNNVVQVAKGCSDPNDSFQFSVVSFQ